jgi:hypothetical protein
MGMSKDWAPKNLMVSIFVVQVAGTCGTYTMNCDPNPSHLNSKIPMSILEDGSVWKTMHDIWARTLGCGSICSCSNWWNLTNFAACVVYTDFKGQPKKKPVLILMFFLVNDFQEMGLESMSHLGNLHEEWGIQPVRASRLVEYTCMKNMKTLVCISMWTLYRCRHTN